MNQFRGTKLRKLREKSRLSQGALARALGLSPEFISSLESGKRVPSLSTLDRMAAFFNKDVALFFHEREAPPDAFHQLLQAEETDDNARPELVKFRRYCYEYLRLEGVTGKRLDLAPVYGPIPAARLAEEERRRLGLGDEPVRDVFALFEANGCRFLRQPMPEDSKVSGVFLFLEEKSSAFALVNSAQSPGRQAWSAAHEYAHYLKDRGDGPIIDNPDVYVDAYVELYHPRERYAQEFASRFLLPPAKIQEIAAKEFRTRRVNYDQALYLRRYFGVGLPAVLRALRDLGFLEKPVFEEYAGIDPRSRERELFGADEEGGAARPKQAVFSDRFRLLRREAAVRVAGEKGLRKGVQKKLPADS